MPEKKSFTIQSLLLVLLFNGGALAALYFMTREIITDQQTMSILLGAGAGASVILWALLQFLGGKAIQSAAGNAQPAKAEKKEMPAVPMEPVGTSAVQLLSILQREGRLLDFLQENLGAYEDAQIGAAVRNVHEGCKKALGEYVDMAPVMSQEEGASVTLDSGFDTHAIHLTGNVVGEPPFKGTLRHKGWQVKKIELPKQVGEAGQNKVLAAAEVEIG